MKKNIFGTHGFEILTQALDSMTLCIIRTLQNAKRNKREKTVLNENVIVDGAMQTLNIIGSIDNCTYRG